MKYNIVDSTINDISSIVKYKCNNIFEYAADISEEEKNKIINYVFNDINKEYGNFKMIIVSNIIIGIVGVIDYEDGKMIDEIFIEEDFRNMGIGSDIIEKIVNETEKVYLWVYMDNVRAVKLYKKIGFVIIEENKDKYLMRYEA